MNTPVNRNKPPQRLSLPVVMSALALALSAATLGLAVNSRISQARVEHAAEERAYQRIVAEIWAITQPIYDDLGLPLPTQEPRSLRDALGPLVSLSKSRTDTTTEQR